MARFKPGRLKLQRKLNAIKKARIKRIIIIGVCALIGLALILSRVNFNSRSGNNAERYSDGGQTVSLHQDGSFTAVLAHNNRKSGTYTRTTEGDRISVSFNEDGNISVGRIANGALHLPHEWDDGHHHGNILPRRR